MTSLKKHPIKKHPIITNNYNDYFMKHIPLIEPTARWIRVKFGDKIIADSKNALLLIEYAGPGKLPTYYFPRQDVKMEFIVDTDYKREDSTIQYWDVKVGEKVADHAASSWINPPANRSDLKNYITFKWHKMDTWLEEEEEISEEIAPEKNFNYKLIGGVLLVLIVLFVYFIFNRHTKKIGKAKKKIFDRPFRRHWLFANKRK